MAKNKFRELYDYCQTLSPKVSRNDVIRKIKELANVDRLRVMKAALDITTIRGYFLSAKNVNHPIVKAHGTDVIVLARGLNECWDRFVQTKEAMHLLDTEEATVSSAEIFEGLLNDFETPSAQPNQQLISDWSAIWMALACLCPEKDRLSYESLRNKKQIDDYGIALQLKIPEQYVPLLFRREYRMIIDNLLAEVD